MREVRKDSVEIEGAGEPTRAHMAPPGVWAGDCRAAASRRKVIGELRGQGQPQELAQPHLSLREAIEDTWLPERGG